VPEPRTGEVLTRTIYISIDPANRAWMSPVPTYTSPVEVGEVMDGFTLGEVIDSKAPDLQPGHIVEGMSGWQDYAVTAAGKLHKVEKRTPLSILLSGVGVTGKTAYFGLLDVGAPRTGETVVVSAAAGAVGSMVGQIAKIRGCRAVGIAGSDEKCRWITQELAFDAAINYKTESVAGALRERCPQGIDVYFDNVAGDILEAALFRMNPHGRIVCCGSVSQYDTATPAGGPRGVPGLLVVKRIRMEGFVVMDFYDRRKQAEDALGQWISEGRLKVREDIIDGLENAPRALIGLLHGENTGKRMIRVSTEPA